MKPVQAFKMVLASYLKKAVTNFSRYKCQVSNIIKQSVSATSNINNNIISNCGCLFTNPTNLTHQRHATILHCSYLIHVSCRTQTYHICLPIFSISSRSQKELKMAVSTKLVCCFLSTRAGCCNHSNLSIHSRSVNRLITSGKNGEFIFWLHFLYITIPGFIKAYCFAVFFSLFYLKLLL